MSAAPGRARDAAIRPRLPWHLALPLGIHAFLERPRSLVADSRDMVAQLPAPPLVTGTEHIPPSGPACFVANHYQRPEFWIGWPAAVINVAVHQVRGEDPPLHWLVISELYVEILGRRRRVPTSGWAFQRVGRNWGMVPLSSLDAARSDHARAVRALYGHLQAGRAIGLFPEGQPGRAGLPREPHPGAPRLLARFARDGAPIIPVAAREWDGTLAVRFGAALAAPILARPMDAIRRLYDEIAEVHA